MNKMNFAGVAVVGALMVGGAASMVSAQSAAAQTGLTEEQVIEIALSVIPGEVQEVELEREDGMQVYEIEILSANGSEMEVEVNALTGDVLEVEAEDDDDHDDDHDDDCDDDDEDDDA